MAIEHIRRTLTWTGVLTLLFTIGMEPSSAIADSHCRVELGRGWAQGNGRGTIVMKKDQKACGSALYSVPDRGIAVDTIRVESEPKNGRVTIDIPKFLYTPNSGFTGRDRLEMSAEGPDAERRQRIRLKGEVTVQVDP